MATSGTVGTTVLDTAKLLEKTYRRCGIPSGGITPELVDIAKENLFLLFQNFSNRGINLWCIDSPIIGVQDHNNTYQLPTGTIGVLNANLRRVTTLADTILTTTATTETYAFIDASIISMVGFVLSAPTTGVTISGSNDNITYTNYKTESVNYLPNVWYWIELDATANNNYWKLSFNTTTTVLSHSLSVGYTDLKMSLLNWDDYLNLPNKRFESANPLQFVFDRQMQQSIVLYPVPNDMANTSVILRTHRQIQDVGSLSQSIEVPDRWLDAITWELASMCAVEVPSVPQDRIQLCQQMAGASLQNSDREEVDGSGNSLLPNIGCYNA